MSKLRELVENRHDIPVWYIIPKEWDNYIEFVLDIVDQSGYLPSEYRQDEFDFFEAVAVYVIDYNDDVEFIYFLKYMLRRANFRLSVMRENYEDLSEMGQDIYDVLKKYGKKIYEKFMSEQFDVVRT